jgi:hypothetical protein
MAEAWCLTLGGDWVEPHLACLRQGSPDPGLVAVMAERGADARAEPVPSWSEQRQARWDLVVPFELGTGEDWGAILEGVRAKHWDLTRDCPAAPGREAPLALRRCRDGLRERVDGLVGGFRLKAREDAGDNG